MLLNDHCNQMQDFLSQAKLEEIIATTRFDQTVQSKQDKRSLSVIDEMKNSAGGNTFKHQGPPKQDMEAALVSKIIFYNVLERLPKAVLRNERTAG